MKFEITNDGKERGQSWEIKAETDLNVDWEGCFDADITSWGLTEKRAKENFQKKVDELIVKLVELKELAKI